MSGKKLINKPEDVVDEALEGLTMLHPGLRRIRGHRVILREKVDKSKVALMSGGGSGHEPFCAGFIGAGMLTGGVAGSVFASPPTSSILEAIRTLASDNPAGVMVVVINYTGDRINFGLAVERARREGLKVDMFVNGEDCALTTADKTAGRRGLCGTMFIFKIAGAMAEAGESLETIKSTMQDLSANMGTMGLALGPCSLPGHGPLFSVGDREMEVGLGVHGEAGVGRVPLASAHEAVNRLLNHMTNPESGTRIELRAGEELAVILNNLGGTSKLEELIVAREIVSQLESRGYRVVRMYAGHLMTSLEMAGILVSLLKVTGRPEWLTWLDEPTAAPAWPTPLSSAGNKERFNPDLVEATSTKAKEWCVKGVEASGEAVARIKQILEAVAKTLLGMEERLNILDSGSGDGDCGSTLALGAKALKEALPNLDCGHPAVLLQELGALAEQMGGTSGGIYSLLFTAGARAFQDHVGGEVDPLAWVRALEYGLETVSKYGGAEPGDRTMIDALHPALQVLKNETAALLAGDMRRLVLDKAAAAAQEGADRTETMPARAGRASYVAKDKLVAPDPGAIAAAAWFRQIAQAF